MAETGKSNYKLQTKPGSKHQNGIIGPEQHTGPEFSAILDFLKFKKRLVL
jgi:hypothetical protein